MALLSGVALQERMIALMAQKQGLQTQQTLLALPLLIMFLRGCGGPQSKSQCTSVSPSAAEEM